MRRPSKDAFEARPVSYVDWAALERLHIRCGTTQQGSLVMRSTDWPRALVARAVVVAPPGRRPAHQLASLARPNTVSDKPRF